MALEMHKEESVRTRKADGGNVAVKKKIKVEDVEQNGSMVEIDAATEARLLRKLDIRIVPMICWIYLMNFMDRGLYTLLILRPRLTIL